MSFKRNTAALLCTLSVPFRALNWKGNSSLKLLFNSPYEQFTCTWTREQMIYFPNAIQEEKKTVNSITFSSRNLGFLLLLMLQKDSRQTKHPFYLLQRHCVYFWTITTLASPNRMLAVYAFECLPKLKLLKAPESTSTHQLKSGPCFQIFGPHRIL